ncbi:unnamed protein product [Didymodactylos carnosus]|uniref:Uncharacterized protein n=1 Tax=Didymodactylos carnosus TaxID=1234261 RepID=A0A8S2CU28_9BILA|nr:unnamed protein product [Didymodactylos carnosus]CAF3518961.1 unnamed protein product [Didymodactylos carnosus]
MPHRRGGQNPQATSFYHHEKILQTLQGLRIEISCVLQANTSSTTKELEVDNITVYPYPYIYTSVSGDINLSKVRGNTPAEYGREVMRKLFTDEELAT